VQRHIAEERDRGTKEQSDKGMKVNDFSAMCLCYFVPLSLNLSASADRGSLLFDWHRELDDAFCSLLRHSFKIKLSQVFLCCKLRDGQAEPGPVRF
jgi:hypothetical protein